jgi:hypothetical protein
VRGRNEEGRAFIRQPSKVEIQRGNARHGFDESHGRAKYYFLIDAEQIFGMVKALEALYQ